MTQDAGEKGPLLCRLFGHKCGPFLTRGFWVVVEHRCKRCGWAPAPPQNRQKAHRAYYEDERATMCKAGSDGDCYADDCPQVRDGEPAATGRHCPLDGIPWTPYSGSSKADR